MPTPTTAISAQGTIVKQNGVVVAELRDTTPPQLTRKVIDTTNHNSGYDAAVVGIRRRAELQFELGFVHHLHSGILNSYDQANFDQWEIDFPDGSSWVFSGYITAIGPKQPVDNGQTASISIKPSGPHIITIV